MLLLGHDLFLGTAWKCLALAW